MKKTISLLLLVSVLTTAVQSQGIHFFNGSFEDALKEAERTNRYVFIDVYTDWCKPCRMLENDVFNDPKVGAMMNTFFINYRADAEGFGHQVAMEFNIKAYPSLLFVTPNRTLFNKILGAVAKEDFLLLVDNIIKQTDYGQIFRRSEMVWASGTRTPEFVSDYLRLRTNYGLNNEAILEDYLFELPADSLNLLQTEKVIIVGTQETKGAGFKYLLEHMSSHRCGVKLNALLTQLADRAVQQKDQKAVDEYLQLIGKVSRTDWEAELKRGEFQARFFLETGNKDAFIQLTDRFVSETLLPNINKETLSVDSVRYSAYRQALEGIGWQYAHYIKNKEALKVAFNWLEQLNQLQFSIEALCYQAMIADKLGDDTLCCKKLETAYLVATTQNRSMKQWDKMQQRCK